MYHIEYFVLQDETNIFSEALQIDTVVEAAECAKLLNLTRKRLLKSDAKTHEYVTKLLVNHHFMQNILNILESCPIEGDDVSFSDVNCNIRC